MKHSNFVHLHSHTQYSLLDGACLLTELIKLASAYKMPALAITDHGNMFGAIEFYQLCMQAGIKPIIGCEAYIAPESRFDKASHGIQEASFHLILLAKDETGYHNLMKLVSIGYLEGFYYRPRIDKEVLRQYSKGLICLSSCLKGEIPHLILSDQTEQAYKVAGEFLEIFGKENFYLELQDHNLPEQKRVNKALLKMAQDLSLSVVATNDFHYLQKAHAPAHDALLCIGTQTILDNPNRLRFQTDEFYFKTADEMTNLFQGVPDAISNTIKIAESCNLELDLSSIHLPHFSPPEGKMREGFLNELVEEGLKTRYADITPQIRERLEHELKIIQQSGFISYFLIVWDFIRYAKENNISVGPGRGCLTPEAKILMGDFSVKDLQDVKKGEYVISYSGMRRKVVDILHYKINEEITIIDSKMLSQELQLTKDHKLPVVLHKMCNVKNIKPTICKPICRRCCRNRLWQHYKIEWKRAEEISKNDLLIFPIPKTAEKQHIYDLAKQIKHKNLQYDKEFVWFSIGTNKLVQVKVKRFIKIDLPLAKLIGYYIAEGYVRTKKREATLGFGFHADEINKQIEVIDLLKETFGLKATIRNHKRRKSSQVLAYSKAVALFFEGICGKYSNDRHIPEEIFTSSKDVKIALLTGLFKGDGSFKETMRISYDSISYQLILQIKCLLSQLNMMSSIIKRIYKNKNWNHSYKLRLSGKQIFTFNNIFKEIRGRIKQQKFYRNDTFMDQHYIYFPVKDIRFVSYKGDVYDLSVEADRTYIANETAVHNSAAGSVVSYALGITDLDPLKYGLLFERFLNPERISLPDIDIDFCYERRDEVIDYVRKKYGRENVAQIITFGTMLAKAAIRDVARVMGFSYGDADRIAKLIPLDLNITLAQALEQEPELMQMYKSDPRVTRLIDTAFVLEGLTRHASTHAAGVVVSEKGLTNYLPLFKTSDEQIVTGYPMGSIEKIGLLKMDFLGLKTLTVIDETVKIIRRTKAEDVDIKNLPLDDEKTYRMLQDAESVGVFQIESRGMRDLLKKLKPSRFEDLIALLALYRPGPIGSGMVDDFINRKHGRMKARYDHPLLEPILKDTYGIILYQEQVVQIVNVMAGFSLSQADLLRRAIGKKEPEVIQRQRQAFIDGCLNNRIDKRIAEKIFNLIEYFSNYGFNKSHSAAYALISYRTAYLKARYPIEFMAALLTSERENTDKVAQYIEEAQHMGIKILPPDINESYANFTVVKDDAIRFGLAAVKNVGEGAIESIVKARKEKGLFKNLYDFCERVDLRLVNRKVLESLIKCGAMDSFGLHRSQMTAILDHALEVAGVLQKDRMNGQYSLFDEFEADDKFKSHFQQIPDIKEWPEPQLLAFEKALLGFYISSHPLAKYEKSLRLDASQTTQTIGQLHDGDDVSIGGIITKAKFTFTKKLNEKMAIIRLEDLKGTIEVLVFPRTFKDAERYIREDAIVFVRGKVNLREDPPKIVAEEILPLEEARLKYTQALSIELITTGLEKETLNKLRDVFLRHKGSTPVYINFTTPDKKKVQIAAGKDISVAPTDELISEIEALVGEGAVNIWV